jgi:hypothetical protein
MQNQSSFDFVKITFPPLLLPWFRVFQIPWRITRLYLKNWHFSKAIDTLNPLSQTKLRTTIPNQVNCNMHTWGPNNCSTRLDLWQLGGLVYGTLLKKLAFSNYCVIQPLWVLMEMSFASHYQSFFNSIFFFWEKLWCKASNLCNKNIAWCMCKSYLIFSRLTTSLFSSTHLHGYEKANQHVFFMSMLCILK